MTIDNDAGDADKGGRNEGDLKEGGNCAPTRDGDGKGATNEDPKGDETTRNRPDTATTTTVPTTAWRRKRTPSSSNHSVEFTLPPKADACQDDGDDDNNDDDDKAASGLSPPSSHKQKLTYKRSLSALAPPTPYDTHLLKRAVTDAGRWAYGIMLVEVWALNHDHTFLHRPDDGYWIDPTFHNASHCPGCPVCQLVDPSHPKYVPPNHQSPGQGLPGVLWSEVARSWTRSFRETLADKILGKQTTKPKSPIPPPSLSSSSGRGGGMGGGSSSHNSFLEPYGIHINTSHFSSHIVWRSIPQLESDPDQPWNPRLQLLATLGLGWAAAVPFNLHGDQGIVIYVARDRVDQSRLQSESNEAYLVSAADMIAAAYALRGPRQDVVKDRHEELSRTLRIVRNKVIQLRKQGVNLKEFVDANAGILHRSTSRPEYATPAVSVTEDLTHRKRRKPSVQSATKALKGAVRTSIRKARGAGAPIPPVYSWKQSFLTFFGSFTTLLAITSLSDLFSTKWGPDYGIVLGCVRSSGGVVWLAELFQSSPKGNSLLTSLLRSCLRSPFGASMTLLYGLTAAPASQPRNVILGQIFSMTIAVAVSYLSQLPVWLRQSLGAALAITCMVKLGVTHPPAGATALILSTTISDQSRHSWFNVATSLIGNVIAVVMSTFINNLSDKRQYPMYWGLSWTELVEPIKEVVSSVQERIVLVLARVCECCGGCFQVLRSRHGRRGHQHRHRRGGSPTSRLRPVRRVGLEEDLNEGSV